MHCNIKQWYFTFKILSIIHLYVERFELFELAESAEVAATPSLHEKVSLLAGGNLAHVEVDAVVNASNNWLTTGKGIWYDITNLLLCKFWR